MFRARSAIVFVAVLGLAVSAASAQTQWRPTGKLDLSAAGEATTFHTFATHVSKDLASRVDDAQAKAVAEKVAGTEQHTATFMLTDPVKVGGSVMVPARLFVIVDARTQADPRSDAARVHLEFGLDPKTGELLQNADRSLKYHPAPYQRAAYYGTSDANVTVDAVKQLDEHTLSVSGHVSAVLQPHGDALAGSDPMEVDADFQLNEVAGDTAVADLLTQAP